MPVLDVRASDPDHLLNQIGEFKSVDQMLQRLALETQELATHYEHARSWARRKDVDMPDLANLLASMSAGLRRTHHRVSVVAQVFYETWNIGEALLRAVRKNKTDPTYPTLVPGVDWISHPPADEEIEDLLNG